VVAATLEAAVAAPRGAELEAEADVKAVVVGADGARIAGL
jgi:hypothetical protein